jgi:hypothetical protein
MIQCKKCGYELTTLGELDSGYCIDCMEEWGAGRFNKYIRPLPLAHEDLRDFGICSP